LVRRRVHREEELASQSACNATRLTRKRRTAIRLRCGFFFFAAGINAACVAPGTSIHSEKDTLVIGYSESAGAGTEFGLQQVARTLSLEGLTQLSPDGRVLPRLADRWAWENGDLRLRVYLHPNISFHNGTKLSAEVAADVLRAAISRPANRALYPSLNYVTEVRPAGELQVTLDLSQPSAFLPEDLEIPLAFSGAGIGTGPFRIVRNDPATVTLERFEGYHEGEPSIRSVAIRPFQTLRTTWTSLLRGDVDMATDVPAEAVEFVSNDAVQVISFERRYQYLMAFNLAKRPFSSATVRRALNAAIDRPSLIRSVLQGHGTPSSGPLWPKYWAYDAALPSFSYDPALAISLLDNAGLKLRSSSSQSGARRSRLHFTCLIPANFSIMERVALNIQKQLYNVGVDVDFESVPAEQQDARIRDGQFEAVLVDMISGPTPGRAYIFWRSARQFKGLNVFGYEDKEAERLFDVLRTSTNDAAVRLSTRELQRVFVEDPPALFLTWNERARAVRRDFDVPNERGRDPLLTLWRWKPISNTQVVSTR
jgi:ABC-type transport system substrate-binding protein